MRFQVPQFIETETKIVGPFTLKQFLWLTGGVLIIFMLNFILPFGWLILVALPIGALSLALAFLKINGMPFFNYLVYAVSFMISGKKFIFSKEDAGPANEIITKLGDK